MQSRLKRLLVVSFWATASLGCASAFAQTAAPHLEYSSVIGVGGTINIIRLPITLPGGAVVYKDVKVTLTADDSGVVKGQSKTTSVTSPTLNTSNIVAGNYVLANGTGDKMSVTGPGPLDDSSEAKWNLIPTAGNPCGAPATFYTGDLTQNPLYKRLQAAGIVSAEYSYGIVDSDASCNSGVYVTDSIIGVAQDGAQLEVASFTSNGKDSSKPVARELYKMTQ